MAYAIGLEGRATLLALAYEQEPDWVFIKNRYAE